MTRAKLVCMVAMAAVPSVWSGARGAEGSAWSTSYEEAAKRAASEGKVIIADFTGSDWCPWCIKLKKEMLDSKEFIEWADKNAVLLEVDFPKGKRQAPEVVKQNKELAAKYKVSGFPTVLILEGDGTVIGTTGYTKGGVAQWLAYVQQTAEAKPGAPKRQTRRLFAQAREAEAKPSLGEALAACEAAAESAKAGGVEASFTAELAHGTELAARAAKEYDAALALAAGKRYDECFAALEKLGRDWAGCRFAKQAQDKLAELRASDQIKVDMAAAASAQRAAEAEKVLAQAREAIGREDYPTAAELLKRVAEFKDTPAATAAAAESEKLAKDPKVAEQLRKAAADRECQGLLGMARTYIANGMNDKAAEKLDKIIKNYPGTSWAEEAAKLRRGL